MALYDKLLYGVTAKPQTQESITAVNKGTDPGEVAQAPNNQAAAQDLFPNHSKIVPTNQYVSPQYVSSQPAGNLSNDMVQIPQDRTWAQQSALADPSINYKNASGGQYGEADWNAGGDSYWQGPDGKLYKGSKDGTVTPVNLMPWDSVVNKNTGVDYTSGSWGAQSGSSSGSGSGGTQLWGESGPAYGYDSRLDALIDDMSSMNYDNEYNNLLAAQLKKELMNAAAAQRGELANRLSASGIEGGMAQSNLASIDREAMSSLASGLADIKAKGMEQAYDDRQKALAGILEKMGIDVSRYGIDKNAETQQAALSNALQIAAMNKDTALKQLALDEQLGLGNLSLNNRQLDLDELLGTGQLQLGAEQYEGNLGLARDQAGADYTLELLKLYQYADESGKNYIDSLLNSSLTNPAAVGGV